MAIATVWVLGSYGRDDSLTETQRGYARRLAERLGALLAAEKMNVVSGESDLLVDLCRSYRRAVPLDSPARAIMIHGSLRSTEPVAFLGTLLRDVPRAVIAIGGTEGGRATEEARLAHKAGLPIGSFLRAGGIAEELDCSDANWNHPDPSDAARECILWLRRRIG